MSLLLDSNTVNYALKGRQPVIDRLDRAVSAGSPLLLCSIVHYEVTRYLKLKGSHRLARFYEDMVASWRLCDLSSLDWDTAAQLWAERHRLGRSISDFDLLVAVVARRESAVLVTSNTRHFEGLDIVLENWMAEPSSSS